MKDSQETKSTGASSERSDFRIPRMDCASEEQLVRMAIDGDPAVRRLSFDLPSRSLSVWHRTGAAAELADRLRPLGLGAELVRTQPDEVAEDDSEMRAPRDRQERRTLLVLLAINGTMFFVELVSGLLVQSTGLVADSLDMLADALVYGMSLYVVGRAAGGKLKAARMSGYLQLALALGALAEVVRRSLSGSDPEPFWMLGVAAIALVANVSCLFLISRHREGGAHMKASYIFSANDVLANCGVIVAGALVAWTGSRYPDLVIGAIVSVVVLMGAVRILRIRA